MALAAAAALDPGTPAGAALVVGVPTLGIFLVRGAEGGGMRALGWVGVRRPPSLPRHSLPTPPHPTPPTLPHPLTPQAWLRVVMGDHTLPQVAVGWLVGSACAAAWHALGARVALPLAAAEPALQVGGQGR